MVMLLIILLFNLLFLPPDRTSIDPSPTPPCQHRLTADEIEKALFIYINQERRQRQLPQLEFSPPLTSLARKHSRDMAARSKVSHFSSSGDTYTDRLISQNFFFKSNGENVAFSDTFDAEYIHQSFMESPGHRENILEPNLDLVGIGVFYKENQGYYVTEDFLQTFALKTDGEDQANLESAGTGHKITTADYLGKDFLNSMDVRLKKLKLMVENEINSSRKEKSYPPFIFQANLNTLAKELAVQKAQGLPLPPVPKNLGRVTIHFFSAPSIKIILPELKIFNPPLSERGGMGIAFNKNHTHPGGAFFFVFVIQEKNEFISLNTAEVKRIVEESINSSFRIDGSRQISLDKSLSKSADSLLARIKSNGFRTIRMPSALARYKTSLYKTGDLKMIPASILTELKNYRIRKIGLGLSLESSSEDGAYSNYYLVLILYR